jgi:molybdate transport system ATP-binding protein
VVVGVTGDGGGLEARIVVHRGTTFSLDVELRIEAGTTAALLGPNGAGKSTAVNAIAGILPIDRGRIAVAGRSLDDPERGLFVPPEQRRVGVVFQDYLLFEHLSVIDNVAFGPASSRRRRRRRESRQLVWRWIEALDLADLAHRRPRELSGGQAQRVALARALASEPDVLLLDEPLAALDVASRSQLRRTLAEHLSHYGGPRLVITHDPTDAFLLADRVHVVENGRLTQAGTPPEMRCRPATAYVAALAGTNLLTGVNDHGSIALDDHPYVLQAADTHTNGPVLVTIHPSAVALHDDEPHGSPRNTWPTTVATVEPLGEITRVTIAKPVPLTVDITPAATAALGIVPGRAIWASVKATEIAVNPS